MQQQPIRYRTSLEDSSRWREFPFRSGDIVISAPSKSGTTWMQMICALLIFQDTELPAPLTELSPWLDTRLRPFNEVLAQLESQKHRRFIKTHTPLDGLPDHPEVMYVVVARDPRDVAVSLLHQAMNLHRGIFQRHRGDGHGTEDAARPSPTSQEQHDALVTWMCSDEPPERNLATLAGLSRHLITAWRRRGGANVQLLHYRDLSDGLEPEMRRLAQVLNAAVTDQRWPTLVDAARFHNMRRSAAALVPDERLDIYRDATKFFRSGTSGQWRQWFSASDQVRYRQRIAALLPTNLDSWLHRDTDADS